MKVTIEISLYPLVENYTSIIIDFIKRLKSDSTIKVFSTAMSTYITGDYDIVMKVVTQELKEVHEKIPDSSTIMKIIPKDLHVEKGFLNF
ncbi:MAG: YkoF family thiamine/hydroxymethylpyrimidine-binding protein [Saprospiraceae bacterium]|nr:YkoF family thiamine/hydroxymethylpyrimidine-binding protein [Saprospiraceae bacterium]